MSEKEQSIKHQIAAMEGLAIAAEEKIKKGDYKKAEEELETLSLQAKRFELHCSEYNLKSLPKDAEEVKELKKKITEAGAAAITARSNIKEFNITEAIKNVSIIIEYLKEAREIDKKFLEKTMLSEDFIEIYKKLAEGDWFVESFQEHAKQKGNPGERYYYDKLMEIVNHIFGTRYVMDFGDQPFKKAYIVLEKMPENKGRLICYGDTHLDSASRWNPHRFFVKGDYHQLNQVIDFFRKKPGEIRDFVKIVFGWENKDFFENRKEQVDLFSKMEELNIYTEETGVQRYIVPIEEKARTVEINKKEEEFRNVVSGGQQEGYSTHRKMIQEENLKKNFMVRLWNRITRGPNWYKY